MNREFEHDMQRVVEGSLSRDEAAETHGAANVGEVLLLHDRLSELSSVEVEVAPWYLVAPHLAAEPTRRRGRRAAIVSVVAGLILIPAAAEGIEAIAPDAVRGTVIDRITDVLPWDNDPPATDQVPVPLESEVPNERDQRGETDVAPTSEPPRVTDTPDDGARPVPESVDGDRPQDPQRPDVLPPEAPPSDRNSDSDRGQGTDRTPDRQDGTDARDRRDGRSDAVETDPSVTSPVPTDRPIEQEEPIEPTHPPRPVATTLPPGDARADRPESDAATSTTVGGDGGDDQSGDERD